MKNMRIPYSVGQKLVLLVSVIATVAAIPSREKPPRPPVNYRSSDDVPHASYVRVKPPVAWVCATGHDYPADPAHRVAQYLGELRIFELHKQDINRHTDALLRQTIRAQEQSGMGSPVTSGTVTPLTDSEIVRQNQEETNRFILEAYPAVADWFRCGPTPPPECSALAIHYGIALRKKARTFTGYVRCDGGVVKKDNGDAEFAQARAELRRLYELYPELYKLTGTPFSIE